MATSGSFNTSSVGNFYFSFEWWRTGYNSSRNEHYIHYIIKTHNTPGNYRTVYDRNLYINNGLIYADTGGVPMYDDEGLVEGDFTITSYNSAGDGSFSAYFEAGVGISSGANCSGSGNFGLDRIPRFASITNAPSSVNDESSFWFSFSNPANTTLSCWLEVNPNGTHRAIRNLSGTSGTYTWTLTETERNELRSDLANSNSGTMRIGLYSTIGGSTQASYVDKPFSIINATPIFENFTYRDTNTDVTDVTGDDQILVKGLSTLQATITSANKMIAQKQATPKNYTAIIDNVSSSANYSENDINIVIGTVSTSGLKRLNVRAYDSRNNSALVYKDVTVLDYEKPIINATVERLNNFEATTTLSINGTFSLLTIDNEEKNTIQTVKYRYRETNGEWENWTTVTATINNNTFSCNNIILTLDSTKSFEFEIQAEDNLQSNTVTASIDIGKSIFFISSNQRKCYINNVEVATIGTVLFEGSVTNGNVTLTDSLSNYITFEVYGYTNDPYYKQAFCKKYSVDNALNNHIDITQSRPTMNGLLLYTTILNVTNTGLKLNSGAGPYVKAIEMQVGGNVPKTDGYSQTITKVIGYKY